MTTLSLLVDNSSGVLNRITGLISRRGFNIKSLAVGETNIPEVSRITISVDCDKLTLEQMVSQLSKLYPVEKIKVFHNGQARTRELILLKVKTTKENRSEILEICELFKAKIIEASKDSIMMEFTGDLDKEQAFLAMVSEHEILELVRTGVVALQRGDNSIND